MFEQSDPDQSAPFLHRTGATVIGAAWATVNIIMPNDER